MGQSLAVLCRNYYQEAKKTLEKKEYAEFLLNLGRAESLSDNDDEMASELSFLKVQGFFKFNQYKKGLEYVEEALKHNKGERSIRLKNYKGVMLGYLGELSEAKEVFLDFVNEVQEIDLLVEVYMNVAWVVGMRYKIEKNEQYIEEMKKYLDLADIHFDNASSKNKGRILDNISFYHYSTGDYEGAIKAAEGALKYFEEKDLPKIYNNLAAIYLELDRKESYGGCSIKGKEYMEKAEILGQEYENNLEIGKAQYNQAMAKLQEAETMSAIDMLCSACEYFKKAQALTLLFDCHMKINELLSQYKEEQLRALKEIVKNDLEGTSLFEKM